MKIKIFVAIGAVLIVVIIALCIFSVNIRTSDANIRYKYNGLELDVQITEEESRILKKIFNGKIPLLGNPSCGFSEDISVYFEKQVFCIARDKCPIIKYKGKYFSVSEKSRAVIEGIFEKYGGEFPCV
ncbi:MAG: hypothetical protein LBO63_08265 [Oscillospiraceae bacterium]|jgi:hypothetical protein|nr:hypothetical protein [Oscillospiraceae bacterium]